MPTPSCHVTHDITRNRTSNPRSTRWLYPATLSPTHLGDVIPTYISLTTTTPPTHTHFLRSWRAAVTSCTSHSCLRAIRVPLHEPTARSEVSVTKAEHLLIAADRRDHIPCAPPPLHTSPRTLMAVSTCTWSGHVFTMSFQSGALPVWCDEHHSTSSLPRSLPNARSCALLNCLETVILPSRASH